MIEQKFVVGKVAEELTRAEAEELFADLGEALGYDKPAGYAEDMARLLRHMQRVESTTIALSEKGLGVFMPEDDLDGMDEEMEEAGGFMPNGVPDGPTRTIPVEQFERDLAARQVADRLTPPARPTLGPGSGIGSGKLRP